MVSAHKERQQTKRFLRQLDGTTDDINDGKFDINSQELNELDRADENNGYSNANYLITESSPQLYMQTLEKTSLDTVRCFMESVVDTVENMLFDAILSAMDNLVIPVM